jgi:hypothetical protein
MGPFSKRVALLCMLLTLWSALAFVYHRHASATEDAQCNVCVVAHSASPQTSFTLHNTALAVASAFRAEPVCSKQRLAIFALSVRPPPSL